MNSSLTRDRTRVPCIGSAILATGPPRKYLYPFVALGHSLLGGLGLQQKLTSARPIPGSRSGVVGQ